MNRTRRDRWCLLALGMGLAAGPASAARAQEGPAPPAPTEAPGAAAPAGTPTPAPVPTADAKVHGTITVDFDKVTISELLRLVSVVEKVDGVIHIVSSKPRDGEPAIVVSGAGGDVALSRPAAPAAPTLVIGRAGSEGSVRPVMARRLSAPASGPVTKGPEFPRLAALGRLLGIVPEAEVPATPRRAIGAARPQDLHPQAPPLEAANARAAAAPPAAAEGVALDGGNFIGALASGGLTAAGPVHSPWPSHTPKERPAPMRDPAVSRTSLVVQPDASKPPAQRHVAAEGESFEGLARKYYGDARYARALWWANRDRVTWPDALTAGKSLSIPGLGQLEPKMIMAGSPRSADGLPRLESIGPRRDPDAIRASFGGNSLPSTPSPDASGFALHVVRPDDTLRIIARERCGDERKALEIIALNRDALSREGRPRVGQCLILPAPAR